MERQPLGKLAPAQPHGASSLRPAHLGPPPASDAAPVKRGRGRPPGAKNKKTLLLEAMMGGEPRNAFTPTPGSRPLDSALSAPLSAPSLSMPSWDSLGRASPSPVPTGVVPQTATRDAKARARPGHFRRHRRRSRRGERASAGVSPLRRPPGRGETRAGGERGGGRVEIRRHATRGRRGRGGRGRGDAKAPTQRGAHGGSHDASFER